MSVAIVTGITGQDGAYLAELGERDLDRNRRMLAT